MQDYRPMGTAPNYTKPFLVTFGFWLFCAFTVVTVAFGFAWAVIGAAALDIFIQKRSRPTP